MAALLVASGTRGYRHALQGACFELFLLERAAGDPRTVEDLGRMNRDMANLLGRATAQPWERVWADLSREAVLTAEQAREYGLVDRVSGRLPRTRGLHR